jgi:3-oxoacyl-[acyl-carrier protein] reductase
MQLMGHGKIVLISSLYSMVTKERRIAYSSSKSALTGLMKTSALELAPYNILVNAVAPGYVMTDMTKKNLSAEEIKNIEQQIPTKRFQSEEDIASLVYFLCSEENKSITGQLIAVDGGYTLR